MNAWLLFVAVFTISIAMVSMETGECDRTRGVWSRHDLSKKNSTHALLVRDRYILNTIVGFDEENIPEEHKDMMVEAAKKIPYPDVKRMLIQFSSKNGQMKSRIWMLRNNRPGLILKMENDTVTLTSIKGSPPTATATTTPRPQIQNIREQFIKIEFAGKQVEVSQRIIDTDGNLNDVFSCSHFRYFPFFDALLIEVDCETTIVKKILTESYPGY